MLHGTGMFEARESGTQEKSVLTVASNAGSQQGPCGPIGSTPQCRGLATLGAALCPEGVGRRRQRQCHRYPCCG
jgi:hypothetical protein